MSQRKASKIRLKSHEKRAKIINFAGGIVVGTVFFLLIFSATLSIYAISRIEKVQKVEHYD